MTPERRRLNDQDVLTTVKSSRGNPASMMRRGVFEYETTNVPKKKRDNRLGSSLLGLQPKNIFLPFGIAFDKFLKQHRKRRR